MNFMAAKKLGLRLWKKWSCPVCGDTWTTDGNGSPKCNYKLDERGNGIESSRHEMVAMVEVGWVNQPDPRTGIV